MQNENFLNKITWHRQELSFYLGMSIVLPYETYEVCCYPALPQVGRSNVDDCNKLMMRRISLRIQGLQLSELLDFSQMVLGLFNQVYIYRY